MPIPKRMSSPGTACGWGSCTQRLPSRWNPFWQTISFGLAGVFTGAFVFVAAGFGVSHLPLLVFSVVPAGHRQTLLTSTLPPVQLNGDTPQVPAATASGVQHCPFTRTEGAGQLEIGALAGFIGSEHTPPLHDLPEGQSASRLQLKVGGGGGDTSGQPPVADGWSDGADSRHEPSMHAAFEGHSRELWHPRVMRGRPHRAPRMGISQKLKSPVLGGFGVGVDGGVQVPAGSGRQHAGSAPCHSTGTSPEAHEAFADLLVHLKAD
jgi:hypothetical protein